MLLKAKEGLVKKVITDKLGRKNTVWVNPNKNKPKQSISTSNINMTKFQAKDAIIGFSVDEVAKMLEKLKTDGGDSFLNSDIGKITTRKAIFTLKNDMFAFKKGEFNEKLVPENATNHHEGKESIIASISLIRSNNKGIFVDR